MINFPSILTAAVKRRNRGGLPSGYSLLLDAADTNSYPGSGTSWFDLSGNNNTATLQTGMTWNAGGYMVLDGVTSTGGYASVNNSSTITPTTGYTVLIWCYPTNLNGSSARWFLCKRTSATSGQSFATFTLTNNAVNADVPSSDYRKASSNNLAVNNVWQHFAICWSGANNTLHIYKNGVIDTTFTDAPSSVASQGANLLIGAGAGNTTRFGGRMGHIAYYNNRALIDSEVLQAYNTHKSRYGL